MSRKRQTSLLSIFQKRQKSTTRDETQGMTVILICFI